MRVLALLCLIALSGCASVALLVSHYMIGVRSQLPEARHDRSLRRQGRLQCQSIKGCGRWLWPDILSTKNRYSDLEGLTF